MLVACRLVGLSALGAHYAGIGVGAQFGPPQTGCATCGAGGGLFGGHPADRRCAENGVYSRLMPSFSR